jgi:farnesyl-diphosphate farnesyltransferase
LCRLADTIEDDVCLSNEQKSEFHRRFVAVVCGQEPAEPFAEELLPLLSPTVLTSERALVAATAKVIRVTASFSAPERAALTRCVSTMCAGMPEFQRRKSLRGLENMEEMGDYCYVVAGVVGEMLTELFCVHCPELNSRRDHLIRLATSFGQGLQMTNILKDIWEDRLASTCWLPRSAFASGEFTLERLDEFHDTEIFRAGLQELLATTHQHLRCALEYALCIPTGQPGIRKFCLWAIGLAILTLRKISAQPTFTSAAQVKISRGSVKATILLTNMALRSDRALGLLFKLAAAGLPVITPAPAPAEAAGRRS